MTWQSRSSVSEHTPYRLVKVGMGFLHDDGSGGPSKSLEHSDRRGGRALDDKKPRRIKMFRTLLPPGSSPNRAEPQVCLPLIAEPIVRPPAAQQRITPSQQSVERPEGRSPPFGHDVALADYLAQPGG